MKLVNYLFLSSIIFFCTTCSKNIIYITSITIAINNISVKDYNEIKAYLQKREIGFEEKSFIRKENTNVNTQIYDWVIKINSQMEIKDWEKITEYIDNPERETRISLSETNISQIYQSGSASSEVQITVKINVTEGSKVYYKETDEEIVLTNYDKNTSSFNYERKPNQEYIDYYVLPPGAPKDQKPGYFTRKHLSHPYNEEIRKWESNMKKCLNKLKPKTR